MDKIFEVWLGTWSSLPHPKKQFQRKFRGQKVYRKAFEKGSVCPLLVKAVGALNSHGPCYLRWELIKFIPYLWTMFQKIINPIINRTVLTFELKSEKAVFPQNIVNPLIQEGYFVCLCWGFTP